MTHEVTLAKGTGLAKVSTFMKGLASRLEGAREQYNRGVARLEREYIEKVQAALALAESEVVPQSDGETSPSDEAEAPPAPVS